MRIRMWAEFEVSAGSANRCMVEIGNYIGQKLQEDIAAWTGVPLPEIFDYDVEDVSDE